MNYHVPTPLWAGVGDVNEHLGSHSPRCRVFLFGCSGALSHVRSVHFKQVLSLQLNGLGVLICIIFVIAKVTL